MDNNSDTKRKIKKASNNKSSEKSFFKLPSKFTVMIIPDSAEEAKASEISYDRLVRFIAAGIAIFIILSGLVISMMVHNHNLRDALAKADTSIVELKDINVRLGLTIESLNDQVEEDKKAFKKIEEQIEAKNEQMLQKQKEAALPIGSPIRGAAAIVIEDPNAYNPESSSKGVIFSTTSGAAIVATGAGLVEEVTDDVFYSVRIVINHENGYKSVYRLPGDVTIEPGATVERNDMLTVLTSDGILSYEISLNDEWINPKDMIDTAPDYANE